MSETRPEIAPEEISIFRAVVVAASRVKQLRRGSKPRVELDGKKHKDTTIAMEEVRRGLIRFTPRGPTHVNQQASVSRPIASNDSSALRDLALGVNKLVPAVESTGII